MTIMTSFTKFAHSLMPYQNSFMPSEYQAIDESMIRFKGRSSIRQYMPMKLIKRGYKVWVRSDETGFMSQFQIYMGKVSNLTEKSRVIKNLSRELVVYCWKAFMHVEPPEKIEKICQTTCVTISILKVSDYQVSTGEIVALKRMNRKSVLFISNFHDPANLETASRRKKDGSKEDVECPSLVNDYNRHMGCAQCSSRREPY
ncbi:piggyBac transposable element-derived protein 4-like [Anthonomus grandis grandis]|uniref:piggyBac transposable element-derived protein 4-like n=1 Tax=Anthonomus grandis grandis TaxID=2921223 RepID=UPI002166B198|nr:piggyBac transposable element-derived protein 4-like [Anthonomus grandis grandis]